jgi:transcriptional regulator
VSPKASSSLYGDLDLLILRTMAVEGSMHGLGVLEAIRAMSGGALEVEDGALYRSLHRLEGRGLLSAEWKTSEKNRRAKFYTITRTGKKELTRQMVAWERHTRAVGRVLGMDWEATP